MYINNYSLRTRGASRFLSVFRALAILSLMAGVAGAQPYRYELTVIDQVLNSTTVRLEDVNSAGTVVGWANYSGQPTRGFTWTEAGGISFLTSPENPALDVRPKGISDTELIAATADRDFGDDYPYPRAHMLDTSNGSWTMVHPWAGCSSVMQAMSSAGYYCGEVQHMDINNNCGNQFVTGEAFSGINGGASTLGRLSQYPSWAHAVNNFGQACGEAYLSDGFQVRGYYKAPGGAITQLPGLGGQWAMAYGLNDTGLIVGFASRPGDDDWVAVRWEQVAGVWTIEDMTPNSISSIAWDVNNSGQIVGQLWDPVLSQNNAVIWVGNQVWNLNELVDNPRGRLKEAKAISETGWIVGNMEEGGQTKRFILKPIDQDSDGDGLLDSWETFGIPWEDSNGLTQYFVLPDADPMHKDIYVEADLMIGITFPDESIERVQFAFEAAPLSNPDGLDGVTLHILRDELNLPHQATWNTDGCWPLDFDAWRTAYFGTMDEHLDPDSAALLEAKAKAYRYCIVADTAAPDPIGGCGQTPGDNFVIFVGGGAYSAKDKAAVFMHELGHNLGLRHGGGDQVNGKPNYPSIMNYVLSYEYPWNAAFWKLDYSREGGNTFITLNESDLDENAGLGNNASFYSSFKMPFGVNTLDGGGATVRATAYIPLDGSATDLGDTTGTGFQDGLFNIGVAQDLNYAVNGPPGIPSVVSPGQTLKPYNDWDNVALPLASTLGSTAAAIGYPTDELTTDAKNWINTNFPMPPSSCLADLNGDGLLDLADTIAFVTAFGSQDPSVDFAEPFGLFDLADILAFVTAFNAGCP